MAVRTTLAALPALTDEELVTRSQSGDDAALAELLARYRRFARSKARSYFLLGADADDVEQEGLIGVYKAARDFRADRSPSFRAFAELCVTRQVVSAIKAAARMKHQPLNRYVSLSGPAGSGDGGERAVEVMLDAHHGGDPVEEVIAHERLAAMQVAVGGSLSGLEIDVLRLYVDGRSYQEIGEHLGRHAKSVDNALQRIKRKLEQHLEPVGAELALAS